MTSHEHSSSPGQRLAAALLAPVDAAGLVYFRLVFYAIMVWESLRFFNNNWVGKYFSGKEIYFKLWPFTFVEPLPEGAMRLLLLVMAVAALTKQGKVIFNMSLSGNSVLCSGRDFSGYLADWVKWPVIPH